MNWHHNELTWRKKSKPTNDGPETRTILFLLLQVGTKNICVVLRLIHILSVNLLYSNKRFFSQIVAKTC